MQRGSWSLEKTCCCATPPITPACKTSQLKPVAAIERKLTDGALADQTANGGIRCVDLWRSRVHFHRFGKTSHRQTEVHSDGCAHRYSDTSLNFGPKTTQGSLDVVSSHRHRGNDVGSQIGGKHSSCHAGLNIFVGNGHARHDRPAVVASRTADRSSSDLRTPSAPLTAKKRIAPSAALTPYFSLQTLHS